MKTIHAIYRQTIRGQILFAALSYATFASADAPSPPKHAKVTQAIFCATTAEAVKKGIQSQLSTNSSCLQGAYKTSIDVSLCSQAIVYSKPNQSGQQLVLTPKPAFVCTSCEESPDQPKCGMNIETGMTLDLDFSGEYLLEKGQFTAKMRVETDVEYIDPTVKKAVLRNIVQEEGNEGPYNIVSAIVRPSFQYKGSRVITAKFGADAVAWNATFQAGYHTTCKVMTWSDNFATIQTVHRVCSSPGTESTGTVITEGTPAEIAIPGKTVARPPKEESPRPPKEETPQPPKQGSDK